MSYAVRIGSLLPTLRCTERISLGCIERRCDTFASPVTPSLIGHNLRSFHVFFSERALGQSA